MHSSSPGKPGILLPLYSIEQLLSPGVGVGMGLSESPLACSPLTGGSRAGPTSAWGGVTLCYI